MPTVLYIVSCFRLFVYYFHFELNVFSDCIIRLLLYTFSVNPPPRTNGSSDGGSQSTAATQSTANQSTANQQTTANQTTANQNARGLKYKFIPKPSRK